MAATQVKSYKLKPAANPGKLEALKTVLAAYQGYLLEDSLEAERQVLATGRVARYRDFKGLTGMQGARRNSWAQVRGEHQRWQARAVTTGRKLITSLAIEDEDLRKEVYTLNKHAAWLCPKVLKKCKFSEAARALARDLFRTILAECPLPLVGARPTITLSNGIRFAKADKATHFGYWLQVPGPTPRKPLLVPLEKNPYFEEAPGKVSGAVTLSWDEEGELTVIASRESEAPQHEVKKPGETLGVDWGFRTLFATSDGRLLGQRTHGKLLQWDAQLTKLDAQLQCLGVPRKTNKRFQRLQARIREFVKNEVGRCLNQLEREGWEVLAFESLDFRGRGLSKRMNRLLSRAGRGTVRAKLARLREAGQEVSLVNPAYSSQECSSCGYVDRANRAATRFACRACGKRGHADVNAAKVLRGRSAQGKTWLFAGKAQVREYLAQDFEARHGLSWGEALARRERSCNGPRVDGGGGSPLALAQAATAMRA